MAPGHLSRRPRTCGARSTTTRFKPFRLAWLLYLVGFFSLLASLTLGGTLLGRAGLGLSVAAFVIHAYGMVIRIADLGPASGHEHVRVGDLGGLGRDALRPDLRGRLPRAVTSRPARARWP